MSNRALFLCLLALPVIAFAGKKGKKGDTDVAPAPAAEPAPAPKAEPAPEPEPEPVPEPEPAPAPNANFKATMKFADGRTQSGRVTRVERGDDWFAEDGWVDTEAKLTVTVEGAGTEKEVPWTEIASVTIQYGNKDQVDCQYDSGFTPWMYMCVLRTTPTVRTTDGKSWKAVTRYKWKLTFDDGTNEEFYLHKLPERQQDTRSPDEGENYAVYGDLQTAVLQRARKSLTSLTLTH